MTKILKDDLKYLLFREIYDRFSDPKAKRKAFGILEATISVLSRKGLDSITLEMVAREAGVTRPLIKHYFSSLEELTDLAIRYIRLQFQKIAIDAIHAEKNEDKMLAAYVQSCFKWVANFRTHALVWLSFLQRCGKRERDRALNVLAVRAGEERIQTLLENGRRSGFFSFDNSYETMKSIQTLITGGLVTALSEDLADVKAYSEFIQMQCLRIAGAKN